MSAAATAAAREAALIAKDPTFADMCDGVIRAARAHRAAIKRVDQAREALNAAEDALRLAREGDELARDALDTFVERHLDEGE